MVEQQTNTMSLATYISNQSLPFAPSNLLLLNKSLKGKPLRKCNEALSLTISGNCCGRGTHHSIGSQISVDAKSEN